MTRIFNHRALCHLWVVLAALLLCPWPGQAEEILVLRSAPLKPYDEAIVGFNRVIAALPSTPGVKTIAPYTVSQLDIAGPEAVKDLAGKISALHPDLVVAVGGEALAAVSGQDLPVISVLAADQADPPPSARRIYPIPLIVSPTDQLTTIGQTLPKVKKLGILYDPRHSAALVDAFRRAAGQQQLTLLTKEVADGKALHEALVAFQGEIDALLLIPDPTVVTPVTMELFALFSLERQVPIIAFAPKFLKLGAAMAVYTTPAAMGEAAGRLARQLLSGGHVDSLDAINPTVASEVNPGIAKSIGLAITPAKDRQPAR